MGKPGWKKHEWDFAGHDRETGVEYSYCDLCGGYEMFGAGQPVQKISPAFYWGRVDAGKVSVDGDPSGVGRR